MKTEHLLAGDAPEMSSPFGLGVWALMLFLLGLGGPVAAQQPDPAGTVEDTLLVSALRLEQEEDSAAASVSVLNLEQLESASNLTVDDALRRVPGFSLFRRASSLVTHPTTQGVSLRGIGPSGVSRTVVLLDGVPLNDPFGGWIYWNRVPKRSLQRVEIVRGGGSSAWGSSALGGVIHLMTGAGSSASEFDLSVAAGEKGILDAQAGWSQQAGTAQIDLYGALFEFDGFPVVPSEQAGPIDVDAFSERDVFGGRVSFQPNDQNRFFIGGDLFTEERGNGTPLTNNDTETDGFRLGWDYAASNWGLEVRLYGQDQEFASTFSAQETDRSSERPALDQFLVDSDALGLGVAWRRFSERNSLVAGADWRATEGQTNEFFFFSNDMFNRRRQAGGEQEIGGLYLQDRVTVSDKVQLELGVRFDSWDASDGFRNEINLSDSSIRRDDLFQDRDESAVSPRVGVVVEASEDWLFRASVYRSFRAPTINELYRPFRVRNDITEANELLEPEDATGVDIGVSRTDSESRFDLGLFFTQVDDPIANVTLALAESSGVIDPCGFVPAGGSCRQRRNLDRTQIRGLELDYSRELANRLRFELSYLYVDAEVDEASVSPGLEGNQIAQVPENQASTRLLWRGPVLASFQLRFVDDQFDDDTNLRRLDSFVTADLGLSRRFASQWQVFANVENLFDEEYDVALSALGLRTIGAPRLFHAGVRFSPSW